MKGLNLDTQSIDSPAQAASAFLWMCCNSEIPNMQ